MSSTQSMNSLEQKVESLSLDASSLEQKADNLPNQKDSTDLSLSLDEPEIDQKVILFLADKQKNQIMLTDEDGKEISTEYELTHKQLHISGLYFQETKDEKTGELSFKPIASELEGRIPVDMSAWAGKYDAKQANYALGKCVEWMRHYNGVSIPTWKGKLPYKPKLEEFWKDHTFAEDGKMPWCVKWINDVYNASVGCDKVYQVCFCANYFAIGNLFHLGACKVAAIMKGRKFADLPALLGVPPKNVPVKSTTETESKTEEVDGKAEKK